MKTFGKALFFIGAGILILAWFATEKRPPPTIIPESARVTSPATSNVSSPDYSTAPQVDYSKLELVSWRCTKEYGYVFVIGEVKNLSSRSLENVLAVGEFRTSSGELVKSEDALLDYNPILAGQTSPFKAGGTDNPEIKKCAVAFRFLMGGSIDFQTKHASAISERARIETLQNRLSALGYDVGSVDGKLGPKTIAAIRDFQKAKGLPVDGEVTEGLLTAVLTAKN